MPTVWGHLHYQCYPSPNWMSNCSWFDVCHCHLIDLNISVWNMYLQNLWKYLVYLWNMFCTDFFFNLYMQYIFFKNTIIWIKKNVQAGLLSGCCDIVIMLWTTNFKAPINLSNTWWVLLFLFEQSTIIELL